MTHGDKFRQMGDEKLSSFLADTGLCPPSCKGEAQKCSQCTQKYTEEMWFKYLTAEVKHENKTEV